MIYSAHQPNYFPYLGLFYKIYKSDYFIFLDDVQFTKSSGPAHERNVISREKATTYLKVPIKYNFKDKINEVVINDSFNWEGDHISKIERCYYDAPFYQDIMEDVVRLLSKHYSNLAELNMAIIKNICIKNNIQCEFLVSSELDVQTTQTQRLIDIGKKIGGTEYYSGTGAKVYMDCEKMNKHGIGVTFSDYKTANYMKGAQLCLPNMSVLDYLFYWGYDFMPLGWSK